MILAQRVYKITIFTKINVIKNVNKTLNIEMKLVDAVCKMSQY